MSKAMRFNSKYYFDSVLFETDNFFSIPSLGSIVDGWILIIPKENKLNFSNLDCVKLTELEIFLTNIKERLAPEYGDEFVIFEHGPSKIGNSTGCSVDYAHIHLVPTKNKLLEFDLSQEEFSWEKLEKLTYLNQKVSNIKMDYLLYGDQSNNYYITQASSFPSQYFRKRLARLENVIQKYNWRTHPFEENIKSTIRKVQNLKI